MESAESETDESHAGRYLYCVVRRDDEAAAAFDARGVEGASLSLVSTGSLSAVVHERSDPYESNAPETVREWLYDHQAAVERAGDVFGTPVPFRFDTIVRGGDDGIRSWLAANEDTLCDALSSLAGRWEYRVEVEWEESELADALAASDDELADLDAKLSSASEGTAFLLEKQYDRRLSELVERRRTDRESTLAAEFDRLVSEARELGDAPRTPLTDAPSGPNARFALLADADERDAVGAYLDSVADEDDASVTYTGPWPPYTFAPEACTPTEEHGSGTAD